MSRQWFKIKSLISIRFSDLTVQSFLTRDSLLRISRINSTRIVVSLYTSWLHLLRARSTLSYHTIVHQSYNRLMMTRRYYFYSRNCRCRMLDQVNETIIRLSLSLVENFSFSYRSLLYETTYNYRLQRFTSKVTNRKQLLRSLFQKRRCYMSRASRSIRWRDQSVKTMKIACCHTREDFKCSSNRFVWRVLRICSSDDVFVIVLEILKLLTSKAIILTLFFDRLTSTRFKHQTIAMKTIACSHVHWKHFTI